MPSELGRASIRAAASVVFLCSTHVAVGAQEPLGVPFPRYDAAGEAVHVRNLSFRSEGELPAPRQELLSRIATRAEGSLLELRRALVWAPFVEVPEVSRLDPVELQKDKERLRRFMVEMGYADARVDYEVLPVADGSSVDVSFEIRPGPPTRVSRVAIVWTDAGRRPDLDGSALLADAVRRSGIREGERMDLRNLAPGEIAVRRLLADEGHPSTEVESSVAPDDSGDGVVVTLHVRSGPRARIGRVRVAGAEVLDSAFLREVAGLRAGDWYALHRLQAGSDRVASLDVVSSASVEIEEAASDSTVSLFLNVDEVERHVIRAEAGYTSDGGIAAEARWDDRNVLGEGQSLALSVTGQSGALAIERNPERFVRGDVTFTLPVLGQGAYTLSVGPYSEYRDDYRDRSFRVGFETTLLRRIGRISSVSLGYEMSRRRIFEHRFTDISGGVDVLELLSLGADGVFDELGARIDRSVFTAAASVASLDLPARPTHGFRLEPSISTTLGSWMNATEFVSMSARATAYARLPRALGLMVRGGYSRLLPFGNALPASDEEGLAAILRLRDELFTAGGTEDVRGWAHRMMGPKFPTPLLVIQDSTASFRADGYTPLGGMERIVAGLELRFPLALLGPRWGGHAFLDGGRVRTTDTRFVSEGDSFDIERFYWATGVGVEYDTVIGPIRVALAYKLNPSFLDVSPADAVLAALLEGRSPLDLEQRLLRRFRLHVSLGAG